MCLHAQMLGAIFGSLFPWLVRCLMVHDTHMCEVFQHLCPECSVQAIPPVVTNVLHLAGDLKGLFSLHVAAA